MHHISIFGLKRFLLAVAYASLFQLMLAPQAGRAASDATADESARNLCRIIVSAEFAYYAAQGGYGALEDLTTAGMLAKPDARVQAAQDGSSPSVAISEDRQRFILCVTTPAGGIWYAGESGMISKLDTLTAAQALLLFDNAKKAAADAAPEQQELVTAKEAAANAAGDSASGVVIVVLKTTKGDVVLEVHPEWSPLGAAHFLELVKLKFYNGAPWFRVLDGFVAQCGISADPELNAKWMEKTILDEPVVQGNQPGYVAFGKSAMPNSRTTHIFINMADNTQSLDPQGFSCFAKVIAGMDVVAQLARVEYQDQQSLSEPGGLGTFKAMYPKADYILKAEIRK
jgi:cyclophilin family peptidyl-prolyl cis-trans isomerase